MNRFRRNLTPPQQISSSQQSELYLGQSGAGPSMYYMEDNEPKRPNIISRGKIRMNSLPQQQSNNQYISNSSPTMSASSTSSYQLQLQQNQHSNKIAHQTAQQQLHEMMESGTASNMEQTAGTSASFNALAEMIVSTAPASTSASDNENPSLDAIPFHLLNDENTQTFLNSGQFETIETEDGNVLLILKEDIENNAANVGANGLTFNSDLLPPITPNPGYTLIDNDVTTCTSSIDSPISSIGINSSVVQQHQEQIEQQPSLIQLAQQQQLETINLSDQIVVNTGDNNTLQPQSYFLLQMSDGTSYLVPTDSLEGMPTMSTSEPTETTIAGTLSASTPVVSIAPAVQPKVAKAKVPKSSKTSIVPSAKINAAPPFKIQLQSQPPPLVPITPKRKEVTPTPEEQKPYRFIMSEESEEKRDIQMNPFIVKVLPESPTKNHPNLNEAATTSSISSPPKLIFKAPFVDTTSQQVPAQAEAETNGDGNFTHSNGLFNCGLCDKRTRTRINMVNHISRCHKGDQLSCPECRETFTNISALQAHHQDVHVIKVFKCVPCSIDFGTEEDLKIHFAWVHASQKNVVVVSSSLPGNNVVPVAMTPDKVKFTCKHCKKQYTCKNNFMKHKVEHWDPRNGRISCDECREEFSAKEIYLNHMLAHKEGLLEYACKICAKGFKSEEFLTKHAVIHRKSPEKVYSTSKQVPVKINNLTSTESGSEGSAALNSLASTSFPKDSWLSTLQSTTQKQGKINQVFLCSRCDIIFTTSDALKSHFDEVHPHLIGKQQVVLKSRRVPATYLENKLNQQQKANSLLEEYKSITTPQKSEIQQTMPVIQEKEKQEPTESDPFRTIKTEGSALISAFKNNLIPNRGGRKRPAILTPSKAKRNSIGMNNVSQQQKVNCMEGEGSSTPTHPKPEIKETFSIIQDKESLKKEPEKSSKNEANRSSSPHLKSEVSPYQDKDQTTGIDDITVNLSPDAGEDDTSKIDKKTPKPMLSKPTRPSKTKKIKLSPDTKTNSIQVESKPATNATPKSGIKQTVPAVQKKPTPSKEPDEPNKKQKSPISPSTRVSSRQNKGQTTRNDDFDFDLKPNTLDNNVLPTPTPTKSQKKDEVTNRIDKKRPSQVLSSPTSPSKAKKKNLSPTPHINTTKSTKTKASTNHTPTPTPKSVKQQKVIETKTSKVAARKSITRKK